MLALNSISFRFGDKSIFEDVNLSFEMGKTYGVVGSNGVGKTTLYRCIAGLYKLNAGHITLDRKTVHSTQVSFLPTDPFFYPYMKGKEYLEIVHDKIDKIQACISLAESLNIPLDNLVDSYSTGMKKKLAFIARFTQEKKIAIYDEPFNGVDLESNEVLLKLLQKNKKEKVTLISSHILSMLYEVCDSILHIEKGFNISIYKPEEFIDLKQKIRNNI